MNAGQERLGIYIMKYTSAPTSTATMNLDFGKHLWLDGEPVSAHQGGRKKDWLQRSSRMGLLVHHLIEAFFKEDAF